MKYQVLFYFFENSEKYSRLSSAAVVIGTSRIKVRTIPVHLLYFKVMLYFVDWQSNRRNKNSTCTKISGMPIYRCTVSVSISS